MVINCGYFCWSFITAATSSWHQTRTEPKRDLKCDAKPQAPWAVSSCASVQKPGEFETRHRTCCRFMMFLCHCCLRIDYLYVCTLSLIPAHHRSPNPRKIGCLSSAPQDKRIYRNIWSLWVLRSIPGVFEPNSGLQRAWELHVGHDHWTWGSNARQCWDDPIVSAKMSPSKQPAAAAPRSMTCRSSTHLPHFLWP